MLGGTLISAESIAQQLLQAATQAAANAVDEEAKQQAESTDALRATCLLLHILK